MGALGWTHMSHHDLPGGGEGGVQELEDSVGHKVGATEAQTGRGGARGHQPYG